MRKQITNNKGFSLTELMVVVAIIGILATMAVPQVQKFMARARQAEVKTSLGSIFTANKAFSAEYNTYTTVFSFMGFQPEGRLRYKTGFGAAYTTHPPELQARVAADATLETNVDTLLLCPADGSIPFCQSLNEASLTQGLDGTAIVSNGGQSFVVEGRSLLNQKTGGVDDVWQINENKMMTQTQDGIN